MLMLARVWACSLSLSLTNEEGVCGPPLCLQGCTQPLDQSERERERKREGDREKESGREGGRERERERCRICPELLLLFLKGMMGDLAPFS
jgi:hypothetical protein